MRIRSKDFKRFLPSIFTSVIIITTVAILLVLSIDTNRNPRARIKPSSYIVQAGEPVLLDGSSSSDPDGDDLTYHWTIDETITNEESVFFFSFPLKGNFTVVLKVEDQAGLSDVDTVIIDVR
jgi:hypothetical protein